MAANTSINLVDLDFFANKNSLKNFLKDKAQFKDYDFEGSDINLLLEILAVNSYKTGFYQNMVLNEAFLDSAVLRNSVLSRSKELNYTPRSARSSKARIQVSFLATGATAPYTIPKGSQLTSLVQNESYTFSIPELLIVSSTNGEYVFETDIYEGFYVTDTYTYIVSEAETFFKITNRNVDLTSLTVSVYEDGNEVAAIYTRATSLLDLTDKSNVFFVQPTDNGYYEILFGDNNIGRRPKNNATVVLNYRVTKGIAANGAREFTLDFDPTGNNELQSTVTVDTLQTATDGAPEESLTSIKYNAPRHFQTQERAVTAADYKSILKARFPEINAINAFGGEDLSPPRYGKAYISVDIRDVDGLPDSKKAEYKKYMSPRTTFGIVPEFLEPTYTYINVTSNIRFNINVTTNSAQSIDSFVKDAIAEYRDKNLNDFNVIFRSSQLSEAIENSDPSVVSTLTEYTVYQKLFPVLAQIDNHRFDFGTKLDVSLQYEKPKKHSAKIKSAVQSSPFYYKSELVLIDDDGLGNLRIMKILGDNHEFLVNIGTVDYETGALKINDIKIDSYVGSSIRMYIRPNDPDLVAQLNNIITIEEEEMKITIEEIRV